MTPPQIQLGPRSQSSYTPSQEFTFTPSEQNNRILHLKASNWKVFKYSGRAEGWDFGRCSGHQEPKAYGKPQRTWALAFPRFLKSHPLLHCFSQTQNTWKQGGHRSDTQGSVTPAKLNAGPTHSSWKPAGISCIDPGPPKYTTTYGSGSHWNHTGMFPWLHTVPVRTNNQQRSG